MRKASIKPTSYPGFSLCGRGPQDYRKLCSYEMLLNDNVSDFVCLRIVLN
jgi:hypothetical protein